ncbi:MAG: GTP pyrophosphokinase family protein [Lachnospiraceae bacterium]|nr:GTP pyrophosphokinase family protein [Lachnospiraceae bacterium]
MEIQLWRELLDPYELAVNEIIVKFDHLIKEYRERGMYSPIEQVSGRVKSIPSLLEKAQKKKIPIEEIDERIEDLAGIRIICQFVEDIETVVKMIRERADMRVKREKDYISNQKSSGYRSYHIIVYYQVETLQGPKEILVEFQIRTLAMNFWAVIEHSLQYKYKRNMPIEIRTRLMEAANSIIKLDEQMSSVRSEIMEAQNSFQIKAAIVSEILNNIQNIYRVANKREVIKIQDEFYRIYESNDLEELRMFSQQLDIITEGYHAQAISLSGVEHIYRNNTI